FEGRSAFVVEQRGKSRSVLGEFEGHREGVPVSRVNAILQDGYEVGCIHVIVVAFKEPFPSPNQVGNALGFRFLPFLARDRPFQVSDEVVMQCTCKQAQAFLSSFTLRKLWKHGDGPAEPELIQNQFKSFSGIDSLEVRNLDDPIYSLPGLN